MPYEMQGTASELSDFTSACLKKDLMDTNSSLYAPSIAPPIHPGAPARALCSKAKTTRPAHLEERWKGIQDCRARRWWEVALFKPHRAMAMFKDKTAPDLACGLHFTVVVV